MNTAKIALAIIVLTVALTVGMTASVIVVDNLNHTNQAIMAIFDR